MRVETELFLVVRVALLLIFPPPQGGKGTNDINIFPVVAVVLPNMKTSPPSVLAPGMSETIINP